MAEEAGIRGGDAGGDGGGGGGDESRKRKDAEKGDGPDPEGKKGDKSHKHRRTRQPGGAGPVADLMQMLRGLGATAGPELTPAQRQQREMLNLLKASTKNSVSMDMRAEILRKVLAFAETVRPANWDGIDERIAELRQAVATSVAISTAPDVAALGRVIRAAETTWPLGRVQYNSHRWSVKTLRQMAKQKAYQLVVAQN